MIHYMVNNHLMKFPNIFLHVSPLKNNQECVSLRFLKLNEEFDKTFDGIKFDDKLYYKINDALF